MIFPQGKLAQRLLLFLVCLRCTASDLPKHELKANAQPLLAEAFGIRVKTQPRGSIKIAVAQSLLNSAQSRS
jgi:hypothetical protein